MKTKHIIFLHLPKNGGSTINSILNRFYKKENIFSVTWTGTQGNLDDFYNLNKEQKNNIQLIRGHFSFGLHQHFDNSTEYFTFLRNPEDRILSFYTYVKRSPLNRLYNKVTTENMSFKDFILLNDIDGNNGQIRKLSGTNSNEQNMLNKAIENIENHFPVVGLQEYFDESLIVLAHRFNWPIPIYLKQNVSKKKKKINDEEKEIIVQNNQGDNELYTFVETRLKKQMNEVPFFKLKLLRLRILNNLISNNFIRILFGKSTIK